MALGITNKKNYSNGNLLQYLIRASTCRVEFAGNTVQLCTANYTKTACHNPFVWLIIFFSAPFYSPINCYNNFQP